MNVLSVDRSMPIVQDVKIRPFPDEREAVSDKKAYMPIKAQQLTDNDSEQKLEDAVEQINNTIKAYRTELKFAIHKESGMVSVKVIDKRDNSVIREIPSEQTLKFAAHVKKMLGIIFDEFI